MAIDQTFAQSTNAADKSIGFDYQYLYFLYQLLNLKTGQSVGLEVLDDVHVNVNASLQLLFQLKHTTAVAASGKPVNLTATDVDLWKTMSNWSQVIVDLRDGRGEITEQISFTKKTEFHLVSNKSSSVNNQILNILNQFRDGLVELSTVISEIELLETQTVDTTIKKYIKNVLSLDKSVMKEFFLNIRFQLNENEILQKIKRSISEKFVDDNEIEAVYQRLDSNIRTDNFINTKSGKAICISYEDFMRKYKKIFQDSRRSKLVVKRYQPVLPQDIFGQRFISQLLHIGDIKNTDYEMATAFTTQKLQFATNLMEWHQSGQLVSDEISEFDIEVLNRWRIAYHAKFRSNRIPNDIFGAALELIDALRSEKLKLAEEELNTELSNGQLYNLSDLDKLGWYPNWENL